MAMARCWFVGLVLVLGGWVGSIRAQHSPPSDIARLVEKENLVEAQTRKLPWTAANVGLSLTISDKLRTGEYSRAAVRFTDLSMLRLDELTTIEISPPLAPAKKRTLDVNQGGAYFFSREKEQELQIRTPAANGALRGTELAVRVDGKRTRVTMFDGELELSNAHGRVLLHNGEQGEAEVGSAPRKTAVIDAVNIIQWCLYYPGVLDPAQFRFSAREAGAMSDSFAAYREGDLPGALVKLPKRDGGSHEARLYRAAVVLAVGQVEKARSSLAGLPADDPGRKALEQMIAAVKLQEWTRTGEPRTSSEWIAESYYQQSRGNLEAALQAARKATTLSPGFGFAWARVAGLEFSFGRTLKAMKVLERSLELAPRNAQALALQGFLLSAENRMGAARRSFDEAIAIDGALGNAWLGRGLTFIRQGHDETGRRDMETAAVLEPNRSILHSYLGKAFSLVGQNENAHRELDRAKSLDPDDPTPWLYSAIQRKQENRYNDAVDDLEKSVALNDNRRVYRSRFLLDEDLSIRGTNLAAIYLNNGMAEQSVREAVRAVDNDYSNAAAHLFLANSYNALRDPARVQLRYETGWFNELLISNLLSPVGAGPLSEFVSEQEYSKLFEKDGLGINSVTDYLSTGQVVTTNSQYGTFGNISYALDMQYQYSQGVRPNNRIQSLDGFATFKLQPGPQDTVFFQTGFENLNNGDVLQRYDQSAVSSIPGDVPDGMGGVKPGRVPNRAALTYHFHERQDPGLLLLGWHHEWSPGNHTLLLLGRLANGQTLTSEATNQTLLMRDVTGQVPPNGFPGLLLDEQGNAIFFPNFPAIRGLAGRGSITGIAGVDTFDLDYRADFETYNAELQQIITTGPNTLVAGGRYQSGEFDTQVALTNFDNGLNPETGSLLENPPALQNASVDFERMDLYIYDTLRLTRWLSLTGGLSYDVLRYPDNFRNPPINGRQDSIDKLLPKVGVILQPWRGATIRGAYTEALSGASFDESVRLEPTQVAGFLQAYRSVLSESLAGSVAGAKYKIGGLSFEQKLPTRTYLGVEYNAIQQNVDRTIGVFDFLNSGEPLGILPSSLSEKDSYREDTITATINQLVATNWSFGVHYRYTYSKFRRQLPGLMEALPLATDIDAINSLAQNAETRMEAALNSLTFNILYNHPCGFFARAEANWYQQENDTWLTSAVPPADATSASRPRLRTVNLGPPGDDFWQFNVMAGYRFYRNQCELSCGLLNLTDQDYQLSPLNPYAELPRERTFVVRCKFSF